MRILIVFILLTPRVICSSSSDSGLFVFGDSLLDTGSNNYLPVSLVKATFPPYGIDFPGGKPTGRFGNGKIYTDFVGKMVM